MKSKTKTTHNYNTTKNNNNDKKTAQTIKKIKNWRKYSKALARRGDFLVLVKEAKRRDCFKKPLCKHTQGHPQEYSDELIMLILIFREIYHQPLRQARDFTRCVLWSYGIVTKIPSIATLSRRAASLKIKLLPPEYYLYQAEPIKLAVDSSGFKIHGEGEWFRRKHGAQKHRIWQESHISLDVTSRLIPAIINTSSSVHDNTMLIPLLAETEKNTRQTGITRPLECILGDGAYDCNDNYQLARSLSTRFIAPPPKNATLHMDIDKHTKNLIDIPGWEDRNKVVREIKYHGGIDVWKDGSGYHQRSLVENAFFRLKNTFGDKMMNRTEANRSTEQYLRVMILNKFTTYGLPEYNV